MKLKCSSCRELKDAVFFNKNKAQASGYANVCKPCACAYNKKYKSDPNNLVRLQEKRKSAHKRDKLSGKYFERLEKSKFKRKNSQLMASFGITLADYNRMLNDQKDSCKICLTKSIDLKHSLAVDHCHDTNKIRGLLCNNCNNGLGRFKDRKDLLLEAIKYLGEV